MANREALRELQSRLASRLQAARTEGVQASARRRGGRRKYLFPLAQSGEIFPSRPPLGRADTQGWFLGVANLRGGLYGVVDLASFVSGQPPAQRSDAGRAESRLVALNQLLEVNCALLIDRLAGLRNTDAFVSSGRCARGRARYFGSGYTDASGAYWQEINLQALVATTAIPEHQRLDLPEGTTMSVVLFPEEPVRQEAADEADPSVTQDLSLGARRSTATASIEAGSTQNDEHDSARTRSPRRSTRRS